MDPRIRLLIHGACADAAHDFSHSALSFNKGRDMARAGLFHVAAGIPEATTIPYSPDNKQAVPQDKLKDEDSLLMEMFPEFRSMGTFVKSLRDACSSQHTCKTGVNKQIATINDGPGKTTSYAVKVLHKEIKGKIETDVKQIYNKLTDLDFYDFFNNQPDVNMLFDAGNINIVELLKNAQKDPSATGMSTLQIRRIINRELINDPAPKTYSDTTLPVHKDARMLYDIKFDTFRDNITYTSFKTLEETPCQRDKFYSLLDFRISKLESTNGSLPHITAEIFQKNGERVYPNNDPHKNNEIGSCVKRIKDAMGKGEKASANKDHITASAHFQCKRSGDWLQAISCMDLGREYTSDVNLAGKAAKLGGNKIILVTHDRILLWYALFMGLDVLFTYKYKEAVEDSASPSSVDDDSGEAESLGSGDSEKILLYFSNVAKNLTPAQIAQRNIAVANENYSNLALLNNIIANYNASTEMIKTKRFSEIARLYEELIPQNPKSKAKAANITLIIQEYIRYTSIDYVPMSTEQLNTLAAEFKRLKGKANEQEAALAFSSVYNTFITKFQSLKIPLDSVTQAAELAPLIETANNAYKHCELFSNTPVLHGPILERRSRTGEDVAGSNIIKLAIFFQERLSSEVISGLFAQLSAIRQISTIFVASPKGYYLDSFLSHLRVSVKDYHSEADFAPILAAVGEQEAAIIKTSGYGYLSARQQQQQQQQQGSINDISQINAASTPQPLDEGGMGKDTESTPLIQGKRKRVSTIFSFSGLFRRVIGMVASLSETFQMIALGGGGPNKGMIQKPKATQKLPEDVIAFMLVKGYIYQNLQYITNVEPRDFDYEFYENLTLLLIASLSVVKNDYKSLVNILYVDYPQGVWGSGEMFEDELLDRCMQQVAHANSNQAIDAIKKDLSRLAYPRGRDYAEPIFQTFTQLQQRTRRMQFDAKLKFMGDSLFRNFSSAYAVATPSLPSPNLTSLRLATSRTLPSPNNANTRKLVTQNAGGSKGSKGSKGNKSKKTRRY